MDAAVFTFDLIVDYPPPYFNPALSTFTLKIGESKQNTLPSVYNPATSDSSGVTLTYTT